MNPETIYCAMIGTLIGACVSLMLLRDYDANRSIQADRLLAEEIQLLKDRMEAKEMEEK